MVGKFDVLLKGKRVGNAQVEKDSLYWHITSRCMLDRNAFYRLIVTCNENRVDLGVCMPKYDYYAVEARIPVKRLGHGTPVFTVEQQGTESVDVFEALKPGKPFVHIRDLDIAYFTVKNGEEGIIFPSA